MKNGESRRDAGRRGGVLVTVLVVSIVIAIIAAGVMQMMMMRYYGINRMNSSIQNRASAEGLAEGVMAAWAAGGGASCSPAGLPSNCLCPGGSNPGPTGASPCSCSCKCTVSNGAVTITESLPPGASACSITAITAVSPP